ncbi:MAG: KpsF/GutQ family sugar-phosphate isomerase [Mariprofundaceae bacterium]|nr:KpsF/GutQ family sugar-phosphate isomerase [Mariprofundaceae bacterium]
MLNVKSRQRWLTKANKVLTIEILALQALQTSLAVDFCDVIACILALKGRLVVVGMGKSGIIARKIAATFASTGTPAFFVHAAEAQHGDLGMITRDDAVLLLSHSGETQEVCNLLPPLRRLGATVIAMTGNPHATLAKHADLVLHIPVTQEACPMNLAPTASTTAALALGDALAVVVLKERGFREEDFARVHPAGSLGRKLMKVADVMHTEVPMVTQDQALRDAITTMSSYRMGITGVQDHARLCGCITDGDLRRILESGDVDLAQPAAKFMHSMPHIIAPHALASEAIRMMEDFKVTSLFVCEQTQILGIIHLHDILQGGLT